MTLRIEPQAEPIPGYRLIERLGGGGFGEVWKAEAPGGLFKAIKFVYGDLEGADEEGARAEQERKSLERIKAVRHPYILSLERYDIIDGRLIIVMELADRTLWDRFKDCRREGLPGIPREELLDYLAETAEALDLMNREHQLQHLDIKPQNLFLNHNHIKVADFGLVKVLEGKVGSVTGGVTPVYAAPETFDGLVSRFSDQYSLAIVYQELLNGHRPFNGATVRQLVVQHLQGAPDLSSLPPQDRAAVGRALSKNPDDRYPTCAEFIKALSPPASKNGKPEAASESGEPPSANKGNGASAVETPPPSEGVRVTELGRRSVLTSAGAVSHPAWNKRAGNGNPLALSIPAAELAAPPSALSAMTSPTAVNSPRRRAGPAVTSEDVLLPALVIGLGQLGQETLKQLRREVLEHYGPGNPLPQLRLLCLDTDPDAVEAATRGGDFALHQGEVLLTRLHRPSYYVKPKVGTGSLDSWLPPKMLYRIPRQQTAAGIRALGRLAFVTHFPTIARRLEAELKACLAPDARREATLHTGLGVAPIPRVFVVTGLGGGTGSGMFIDMAYVVKHALRRLGHERPDVVGLFLLPTNERHGAQTAAQTNAVAALTELQHFAAENTRFTARYNTGDMEAPTAPLNESGPPFRRCVLQPVEKASEAAAGDNANISAISRAAHYLFTDLCTPLGRTADRLRMEATRRWSRTFATAEAGSSRAPAGREQNLFYQTVGTYRIVCPRQQVLGRVSRMLCRRLIQRWMTKDARPLREGIKQWVGEKWAELRLGADQLIEHMHEACQQALRQPAESAFAAVLAPVAALAEPAQGKPDKNGRAGPDPRLFSAVREALEQTRNLVGIPDDGQPLAGRLPEDRDEQAPTLLGTLKTTSTALADDCDLKLARMVVSLIEQPEFRLAGAEETIRQLGAAVDEALQHQEHLAKELHDRSVALYQRLCELLDRPGGDALTGSTWKTPIARKGGQAAGPVAELIELLRSYPKCRYQCLILHTVSAFYLGLRGQLSDQLREVDFCRQRLSELADMMTDDRAARPGGPLTRTAMPLNAAVDECLFPNGSQNLEQAVAHLDSTVSAADLQALDSRIQALVKKQFRALVQVCMSSVNSLGQLAPAMQQEAQAFLAERIGGGDVAEMYLAQHAENEAGFVSPDGLATAFEQAAPELGKTNPDDELCVLAVPPGAAEQEVRELARRGIGSSRLFDTLSDDDIVLYREQLHQGLGDLNAVAGTAREAYRRLAAQQALTPHCRVDITPW